MNLLVSHPMYPVVSLRANLRQDPVCNQLLNRVLNQQVDLRRSHHLVQQHSLVRSLQCSHLRCHHLNLLVSHPCCPQVCLRHNPVHARRVSHLHVLLVSQVHVLHLSHQGYLRHSRVVTHPRNQLHCLRVSLQIFLLHSLPYDLLRSPADSLVVLQRVSQLRDHLLNQRTLHLPNQVFDHLLNHPLVRVRSLPGFQVVNPATFPVVSQV